MTTQSIANAANPAAQESQTRTAGAASTQQNEFLKLLVAQLQGQNPLDPMDGTQFISQLAQFSSLQELTAIHFRLDNIQAALEPPTSETSKT